MESNGTERKKSRSNDNLNVSGHPIVEVHSPNSKAFPKSFMETLMMQRPVLHKYLPEQVQVVYHRRTGDEVVTRRKSKNRQRKKVCVEEATGMDLSKEIPGPSDTPNDSHDETSPEEVTTVESISRTNGSAGVKSLDELLLGATNVDINACQTDGASHGIGNLVMHGSGSHDSTQDCNDIETVQTCLERLDQVASMIVTMNDNISKIESRLQNLELVTSAVNAKNNVLSKKLSKHLGLNATVASDMQKLQSLLNNNMNSSMEAAARLLKKAGLRRMTSNGNATDQNSSCEATNSVPMNELPLA